MIYHISPALKCRPVCGVFCRAEFARVILLFCRAPLVVALKLFYFRFKMNGRPNRVAKKTTRGAAPPTRDENKPVKGMSTPLPVIHFSPTELAQMLEEMQKEIPNVRASDKAVVELKGFNLKDVTTYEEYCRMRDAIMEKTGHPETFDEGGRTALNVDAAAIAGAKMVIDNARSTRAFSKQLMATSGVNEDDILYKGLSQQGHEGTAAKAVNDSRKASLIESLVDFQKQIQFKMNVLKHIDIDSTINQKKIPRALSKSDGPITRHGKNESENADSTMKKGRKRKDPMMDALKTPKQSQELNPLDDKRIYDEYACNIASELREERKKRRRTAPIPFNINLLDDAEEED
ncbi:hypothetical protein PENTCL1PPCAC_7049 [Pristionchus entomophagus]|uniref:Uncharacterized protein n=1 Tax=Pristionchus entomophagus TaxID=358040 RepID=A0AAV5SPP7_9BILA|nr:hypothetical protein PENTCL1PPCAC_7049 [Pristionchus entomophagus]